MYHSDQVYLKSKLNSSFSLEDDSDNEENELLYKIKGLIGSGNGDPGRLQHIHDTIVNKKSLYQSDIKYLESKLNSSIKSQDVPHEFIQTPNLSSPLKEISQNQESKIDSRASMPKGWNLNNPSKELAEISTDIKNEEHKIEQQKKNFRRT